MSKEAAAGTSDRKAAVARAKTACPNPSQPPSWQVEATEYLEQICHEEGPIFIQDGVQAGKASHALFRCTLCRDSNPMIKSSMESHRHGIKHYNTKVARDKVASMAASSTGIPTVPSGAPTRGPVQAAKRPTLVADTTAAPRAPRVRAPPPPPAQPTINVAPTEEHDDPTYWYIPEKYWPAWQKRLRFILQHYDPQAGPTANNGAIIIELLRVVRMKLRRPRGQNSRGHATTLTSQLGENGPVDYKLRTAAPPTETRQAAHPGTTMDAHDTDPNLMETVQSAVEAAAFARRAADVKAVRAATAKLSSGEAKAIKKAVRVLSMDRHETTLTMEGVVNVLLGLHPTRKEPLPPVPEGDHDCLAVRPEDLLATLLHLMNVVAPGTSGLTEELLYAGCKCPEVCEQMAAIITDVRNNKVHPLAAAALRRCRLLAPAKPNGGVRPVAVGECVLKVACTMSVYDVSDYIASKFDGVQYGCSPSGCERIIHACQEALEKDPGIAVMTIDATNAFNTLWRNIIARELYGDLRLSPLWHVFDLAYTVEGELVFKYKGKTWIIPSSEGCRQGCVLGSILFCLGVHPILLAAKLKFPDLAIKALMDDINLWGPVARVLDCFDFLSEELAKVGLVTNDKTTLLVPTGTVVDERYKGRVTVVYDGVKILGTMRSRDPAFVLQFLLAKSKKDETLFRRLSLLPPNQAFTLLQKCGIPRATYLLRTHAPEVTKAYALEFDAAVRVVATHALQHPLNDTSRETDILLHLPPRDGGHGFTRTDWVSEAAYKSSLESCLAAEAALKPAGPSGGTDAPTATTAGLLPTTHPPVPPQAVRATTSQATYVAVINKALCAEIDAMGDIPRAHRHACSQRFSSLWTTLLVGKSPSAEFAAMLRWRAVVFDADVAPLTTCPGCSRVFYARVYHEHKVGCALMKGLNATTTHTAFNKGVQNLCVRAGLTFYHEPRYIGFVPPKASPTDDDDHHHKEGPDLSIFFASGTVTIDFKGINGSAPSYARRSYTSIEEAKVRAAFFLYDGMCWDAGENFTVCCFHVCGRMDAEIVRIVRAIVAERPDILVFKTEMQRLAVVIAQAVGRILLRHGGPRRSALLQARATSATVTAGRAGRVDLVTLVPGVLAFDGDGGGDAATARSDGGDGDDDDGGDGDAATANTASSETVARSEGRPRGAGAGTAGAGDGV